MKHEEAADVFGMVAAVYDLHPERSGELAPVWVRALEELDASDTMDVVSGWLKGDGPEKMPTVVAFVQEVQTLARQRRAYDAPRDPDRAPDCEVCLDNGLVCVGSSTVSFQRPSSDGTRTAPGSEIWAACPACDRGRALEFPLEGVGPWGPDGYWRGRQWTHVGAATVEVGA